MNLGKHDRLMLMEQILREGGVQRFDWSVPFSKMPLSEPMDMTVSAMMDEAVSWWGSESGADMDLDWDKVMEQTAESKLCDEPAYKVLEWGPFAAVVDDWIGNAAEGVARDFDNLLTGGVVDAVRYEYNYGGMDLYDGESFIVGLSRGDDGELVLGEASASMEEAYSVVGSPFDLIHYSDRFVDLNSVPDVSRLFELRDALDKYAHRSGVAYESSSPEHEEFSRRVCTRDGVVLASVEDAWSAAKRNEAVLPHMVEPYGSDLVDMFGKDGSESALDSLVPSGRGVASGVHAAMESAFGGEDAVVETRQCGFGD